MNQSSFSPRLEVHNALNVVMALQKRKKKANFLECLDTRKTRLKCVGGRERDQTVSNPNLPPPPLPFKGITVVHFEKCTDGGSDDGSKVHTIEQTNFNCAKQKLTREEGQKGIDDQGSSKGFSKVNFIHPKFERQNPQPLKRPCRRFWLSAKAMSPLVRLCSEMAFC